MKNYPINLKDLVDAEIWIDKNTGDMDRQEYGDADRQEYGDNHKYGYDRFLVSKSDFKIVKNIRVEALYSKDFYMVSEGYNYIEGVRGMNFGNQLVVIETDHSKNTVFKLVDREGDFLIVKIGNNGVLLATRKWSSITPFVCHNPFCKNPYPVAVFYSSVPLCYYCKTDDKRTNIIEYPKRQPEKISVCKHDISMTDQYLSLNALVNIE